MAGGVERILCAVAACVNCSSGLAYTYPLRKDRVELTAFGIRIEAFADEGMRTPASIKRNVSEQGKQVRRHGLLISGLKSSKLEGTGFVGHEDTLDILLKDLVRHLDSQSRHTI